MCISIHKIRSNQLQQGISLIEVLVSIVILAIALLSLAALHISTLRNNYNAEYNSVAAIQIQNIIERMQANPAGVAAGSYNNITLSSSASDSSCTSTCSPSQVAQHDAYQWNSQNIRLLPAGQGTVSASGDTFTVTIRWDANRTGATGMGCSGNPNVDLACARASVEL